MSGTIRESPADFRNGDLISRLLAATPPYQTNSTFVPPGLYFSEMLKRFVQAKSCPPPQSPNISSKRGRKRSWKDHYGGGCNNKGPSSSAADQSEGGKTQQHKKRTDYPPSVPAATVSEPHMQFPLWYPPFYTAAAYPPPVYFETPDAEPLNLRTRGSAEPPPPPPMHKLQQQDGHRSAFRVPEPCGRPDQSADDDDNKRGTSYLMGHLTEIFRRAAAPPPPPQADEEKIIDVEGDGPEPPPRAPSVGAAEKDHGGDGAGKDLTALIGLELVVDYVKHGRGKGDANDRTVKCCQNS